MPDAKPTDTVTRYGPRKIGDEQFEKQQAQKVRSSRGGTVYGKRKVSDAEIEDAADTEPDIQPDADAEVETDSTEGETEAVPDADENVGEDTEPDTEAANPFMPETGDNDDSGYVTIDELEATLEEDPSLLDLAIEAEKAREDGARKGAVRLFLETELERDDGPREDVTVELEAMLEEL